MMFKCVLLLSLFLTNVLSAKPGYRKAYDAAILAAEHAGDYELVEALLERHVNINIVDEKGEYGFCGGTLLTMALTRCENSDNVKSLEHVKFLISRGANVNYVSKDGLTPMIVCLRAGPAALPILQAHGAKPVDPDDLKTKALMTKVDAYLMRNDLSFYCVVTDIEFKDKVSYEDVVLKWIAGEDYMNEKGNKTKWLPDRPIQRAKGKDVFGNLIRLSPKDFSINDNSGVYVSPETIRACSGAITDDKFWEPYIKREQSQPTGQDGPK